MILRPAFRPVGKPVLLFKLKPPLSNADAVTQLCPNCGLCCNGVLFGDVELQRGDNAMKLADGGMEFFRKGRKQAFVQPCACFDGKLCRIYSDRPKRCATFDCGLLKRVQKGSLTTAAALKSIRETRKCAEKVVKLVRDLGNHKESWPLNRRYTEVIEQGIDFSATEAEVERRGELMMAVAELTGRVERDFLTD
jgi:Fe-S-cluster containining protein